MDKFTEAYIETALWCGVWTGEPDSEPSSDYCFDDISLFARHNIEADCAKFQSDNAQTISAAIETGKVTCGPDFDEMGRAGHDFFLTRCGHGAGYWDGDWPEPYAEILTKAAQAFCEVTPILGDDGEVYFE